MSYAQASQIESDFSGEGVLLDGEGVEVSQSITFSRLKSLVGRIEDCIGTIDPDEEE